MFGQNVNSPVDTRYIVRRLCSMDFVTTGSMINPYHENEVEYQYWEERSAQIEKIVKYIGNRDFARKQIFAKQKSAGFPRASQTGLKARPVVPGNGLNKNRFDMKEPAIFRLGDAYWWAGYDLDSCLADCENYFDEKIGPGECYLLDDTEMQEMRINCDETGISGTFAEVLKNMIADNEEFPCMFAFTEY